MSVILSFCPSFSRPIILSVVSSLSLSSPSSSSSSSSPSS
jgi:hypothetical protein